MHEVLAAPFNDYKHDFKKHVPKKLYIFNHIFMINSFYLMNISEKLYVCSRMTKN